MPNICTTNYVIEGEKKDLDALYGTMKKLQEMEQPLVENGFGVTWLGCLVKALGKEPENVLCRGQWIELEREGDTLRTTFETAWTPCYEVTQLLKTVYPSLCFYYKAEEPDCGVFLKNDAEGKYFPETETEDGCKYELHTEEQDQMLARLIRGIQSGEIEILQNKYMIYYNDRPICAEPLNNAHTVWRIVSLWVELQQRTISLEELNKVFPRRISHYYESGKWYQHLFVERNNCTYDGENGNKQRVPDDCRDIDWGGIYDILLTYPVMSFPPKYATLLKMWSRDDTEAFIKYAMNMTEFKDKLSVVKER